MKAPGLHDPFPARPDDPDERLAITQNGGSRLRLPPRGMAGVHASRRRSRTSAGTASTSASVVSSSGSSSRRPTRSSPRETRCRRSTAVLRPDAATRLVLAGWPKANLPPKDQPRATASQSLAIRSTGSAITVSRPAPQITVSRSPSRARMTSSPAPPLIESTCAPPTSRSLPARP